MSDLLFMLLGMVFGATWGSLLAWQITARRMTQQFLRDLAAFDDVEPVENTYVTLMRVEDAIRRGVQKGLQP